MASSPTAIEAFWIALPTGAVAGDRGPVEVALAGALERGLAACPELDEAGLAAYLARRCPSGDVLDHVERLDPVELALVWACAGGGSAAIARFERAYFGELRVGTTRLACTADELAEVTQEVRRQLFATEVPPRLVQLTARGELRALLRLMALRVAISLRRKAGRAPVVDDADLELVDDGERPDALMAKDQHRVAFRAALAAALATLSARDRTVLRLHALDGVPLAALATMHAVDRATISRWIATAREAIFRETRRQLAAHQGVAAADFDSFVDLIRSRFEVSLRGALA